MTSCANRETPTATPLPPPTATKTPSPTQTPTANIEYALTGTLTLWHSWNSHETQALVRLLELFNKLHPAILFDVLYVPFDDLLARYENSAEFGSGPNILIGPSEWGQSLYESGLILDLSAFFDAELLETINPAALDSVRYREAMIGIPLTQEGVLMYRNKTLIPKVSESLTELTSATEAATQRGNIGSDLERGFFFSAAHLVGIGGQWMDEEGNPVFNDEKGIAWLELLQSFDQFGETEFNTNGDLNLFQEGKVGIIFEGSWLMTAISDTVGVDNVAIDPWPSVENGHLSGYIQTDNIYLNTLADENERILANAFIQFLLTPESQTTLSSAGFIPTVNNAEVDDVLIRQAMIAFHQGTSYPILPEFQVYRDPLEVAMIAVFDGGMDEKIALQTAHDNIVRRLAEIRETNE